MEAADLARLTTELAEYRAIIESSFVGIATRKALTAAPPSGSPRP